jgi:hypothetical protein
MSVELVLFTMKEDVSNLYTYHGSYSAAYSASACLDLLFHHRQLYHDPAAPIGCDINRAMMVVALRLPMCGVMPAKN